MPEDARWHMCTYAPASVCLRIRALADGGGSSTSLCVCAPVYACVVSPHVRKSDTYAYDSQKRERCMSMLALMWDEGGMAGGSGRGVKLMYLFCGHPRVPWVKTRASRKAMMARRESCVEYHPVIAFVCKGPIPLSPLPCLLIPL